MSSFDLDLSKFDCMTDAELEEYLHKDYQSAEEDASSEEAVLYVSQLLAKRSSIDLDTDRAWDTFYRHYRPDTAADTVQKDPDNIRPAVKAPPRRPGLRRAALIAACLAVCLIASGMVASARGINWWEKLTKWTMDTFGFQSISNPQQNNKTDITDLPDSLIPLASKLTAFSVELDIVPTYLPEGTKEAGTVVKEYDEFTKVMCMLTLEDHSIILQYRIFNNPNLALEYQKDNVDPEEYEHEGQRFYITSNMEEYQCIWICNNIECSIVGVPSRELLIQIIDSI